MSYLFGISGLKDNGESKKIASTGEGHLEVAIHSPRLPFGSIHTESLRPEFQADAVYGLSDNLQNYGVSGSGVATTANSLFSVSSGTTTGSLAYIQGRKRLRYRAGQGVVGRFTAIFTTPVASSYQVIGLGHDEDGVYFGYKNTTFGIIHNRGGVREVQTLTVTGAATVSGNVTITLNGTANTIAVTNSANVQRTVYEISQGTYTGWKAEPRGATVVFIADTAGNKTGSMTFSGGATGATATIAETVAGVAATETFIAQSSWNGDKLDGTGASGITLDPTKGNVFQISIQYLGFGAITFQIEACGTNQNNPDFVTVHTIKNPNALTATSFSNPAFPFTMAVYSTGSTTDLTVKCASYAGFIEGQKALHGNRLTYVGSLTTVGSTNLQALFTVFNTRYYKGRANQSVVNLRNVTGALKHTSPCIFYLIKNGALTGNPSFTSWDTDSCTYFDNTATVVTYTRNSQIIWTGHLGDTGEIDHHFTNGNIEDLTLQPGEWITLAARAVTGTPSYVTGSINTREDQ